MPNGSLQFVVLILRSSVIYHIRVHQDNFHELQRSVIRCYLCLLNNESLPYTHVIQVIVLEGKGIAVVFRRKLFGFGR